MALIDECDEILREIIDETERSHTLCPSVEISGIILDTRAISHFLDELEIVFHPLFQTLGFQVLAYFMEILALSSHVILNLTHGLRTSFL